MNGTDIGIIQSDAAVGITTKCDQFVVNGKRCNNCSGIQAFHKAQSAIPSDVTGVHGGDGGGNEGGYRHVESGDLGFGFSMVM